MSRIAKADDATGMVYGWASIVAEDGVEVIDRQGDVMSPAVLEAAMIDFMQDYRAAGVNHEGDAVGTIVESVFITPEKLVDMGIPAEVAKGVPTGAWIGVKLDPRGDAYAQVKSGEIQMFSVQGHAAVEPA